MSEKEPSQLITAKSHSFPLFSIVLVIVSSLVFGKLGKGIKVGARSDRFLASLCQMI